MHTYNTHLCETATQIHFTITHYTENIFKYGQFLLSGENSIKLKIERALSPHHRGGDWFWKTLAEQRLQSRRSK